MKEKRYSREDETHVTLLNLNGEIFPMDNGYWTKFEACRVSPNQHVPHGVRKITWDHKHKRDKISPYEYESASQLLEDFWHEAERIMGQE